jgi:FkbM family methyltransferase
LSKEFELRVPVAIEVPDAMAASTQQVLAGEYDCGLFGERLTVADIGANVGAFAIWATARWPGSTVTAYEPHPATFEILQRNLAAFPGVSAVNAAVFPGDGDRVDFVARYPGDGEAGVATCSKATFKTVAEKHRLQVPAVHPSAIPACDVVKIDAEGSEAEIVRHLDLSATSLVLIEFQNDSNRKAIKGQLEGAFDVILEEEFRWDPLLGAEYSSSLAGDHYGHLFFVAKSGFKLRTPADETRPKPSWRSIASEAVQKLRGR